MNARPSFASLARGVCIATPPDVPVRAAGGSRGQVSSSGGGRVPANGLDVALIKWRDVSHLRLWPFTIESGGGDGEANERPRGGGGGGVDPYGT